MGLSRRKFTKEFKEEAIRRLELGASLAEVARACEVNPNVLHRWRRELREYGGKAFVGNGQRRVEEGRIAVRHGLHMAADAGVGDRAAMGRARNHFAVSPAVHAFQHVRSWIVVRAEAAATGPGLLP